MAWLIVLCIWIDDGRALALNICRAEEEAIHGVSWDCSMPFALLGVPLLFVIYAPSFFL